ncbi:MAG: PadR family transcriptional regulator [Anaerovoracaceae bacterium]|nr:PadR family transcriptional regulator [Anaerovoracaceae bacterium]
MRRNRSNFKMGTVEMIILFLLEKKDLYGYEITSLVEKLSDGKIGITESTLYPTLYKLLGNNFISDKEIQVGKRRTRVYYHLEEAGRAHLESLLKEYKNNTSGICKILECKSLDEE